MRLRRQAIDMGEIALQPDQPRLFRVRGSRYRVHAPAVVAQTIEQRQPHLPAGAEDECGFHQKYRALTAMCTAMLAA